jgi:hypothetical protein
MAQADKAAHMATISLAAPKSCHIQGSPQGRDLPLKARLFFVCMVVFLCFLIYPKLIAL